MITLGQKISMVRRRIATLEREYARFVKQGQQAVADREIAITGAILSDYEIIERTTLKAPKSRFDE